MRQSVTVILSAIRKEGFEGPCYEIKIHYRSTNPKEPGEGEAVACVVDNGEGINAISLDNAFIDVVSGPYNGYTNSGPVKGNIQSHECKETL